MAKKLQICPKIYSLKELHLRKYWSLMVAWLKMIIFGRDLWFYSHHWTWASRMQTNCTWMGTVCGYSAGGAHYDWWKHSVWWKLFLKFIHGAFRNNKAVKRLIRRRWVSYCVIIGFQVLVQKKLFPSFSCHFFYNAL